MVGGTLGIGSVLLLGAFLFPTLPDSASAEEATTRVELTVSPVISIALANTLTVEVLPEHDGAFNSNTTEISVATNSESGYSLYLKTANGQGTLTSQNPASSGAAINAITDSGTGVKPAEFGTNTWGYNLSETSAGAATDQTDYKAMPTTDGNPVIATDAPTEADTYNFTVGTKVDTSLPSGTYSNQVVVSVVTNPAFIPTLSSISNMQEMTPKICAESTENETKQLVDQRDGKKYWVAKLADGNCWMTQDLDYDIPAEGITGDEAKLTDLAAGTVWDDSMGSNAPQATTTAIFSNFTSTGTYSWDPGMYVKTEPANYNAYCDGVSGFDDQSCQSAGWVNVADFTAMTEPQTGSFTSVDEGAQTYDAHYLVGNMYQWNAATAGTGSTITSTEVPSSICPAGWELPKLTGNTSAYNLMSSYPGIFSGDYANPSPGGTAADTVVDAPIYLQYGGFVNGGALDSAGGGGYWWPSTAYSSPDIAYFFAIRRGMAFSGYETIRGVGNSVRCLAPSV